jgi:hypothetical protein
MANALKDGLVGHYPLQSNAVNMVDGVAGTIGGILSWRKNNAGKVVLDDTTAYVSHGTLPVNTVTYWKDGHFYAVLNGVSYMVDEALSSSFTSCVDATNINLLVSNIKYDFATPPSGVILTNQGTGGATYNLTGYNAVSGGAWVSTGSMSYGSTSETGFIFIDGLNRYFKSADKLPQFTGFNFTFELLLNAPSSGTYISILGQASTTTNYNWILRQAGTAAYVRVINAAGNVYTSGSIAISGDLTKYVCGGLSNGYPWVSMNGGAKQVGATAISDWKSATEYLVLGGGLSDISNTWSGHLSKPCLYVGVVPTDEQIATRSTALLAGTAQMGTWSGLC